MRKIFNTLEETTPKSCLKEKTAFDVTLKALEDATEKDQELKTKLAENISYLAEAQKKQAQLSKDQNANLTEREQAEERKKELDQEFKSYGSTCYIIPWYCGSIIRNYNYCVDAIQACQDKADQIFNDQSILVTYITRLTNKSNNLNTQIKNNSKVLASAKTDFSNAFDAFFSCNNSPKFNQNLKLNNSCKQIKQKIKTINQKIISLTNQSFNIKYGNDSLPIMKINKKLYSSAVNTQKEILNELDKARPTVPKEYLSLFSTFYKQTKDSLTSYEKQSIMFEIQITRNKQKKENILTDLPKLEKALSNTIKKFANCKTPPLI